MYEKFYGLDERPFNLSPNPKFLYLSSGHREALNHLRYGLTGRPGLTLVVGEAGTGKTTLVKAALEGRANHGSIVHMSNPTLTRPEFFDYLASGFGFDEKACLSKSRFLRELESALTVCAGAGTVLALIVDEAQSLPDELLEEIRLLTNVEGPKGCSLAVSLVGQPALATRLNHPALRQLKQRVALRCELVPLDLCETGAYIATRIRVAGGDAPALFNRDAVVAIHERSNGIPRSISVICDNALVTAFALGRKRVERDIVDEVCRDFELGTSLPPVLTSAVAAVERARDALERTRSAWRWGPRLAAAAIFGGVLLGTAWLGDRNLLVLRSLPSVAKQLVAGTLVDSFDNSEPTFIPTAASPESAVATPTVASAGDTAATEAVDDARFRIPTPDIPTAGIPTAGDRGAVLPLGAPVSVPAPQVLPARPAPALPAPSRPAPALPARSTPAPAPPARLTPAPSPPAAVVAPAVAPVPLQPAVSTDIVARVSDVPRVDVVKADDARIDDEELVRRTLQQYRMAYDGLNARQAQAVWPGVNETTLERAFDGLASQRLTFETCDVQPGSVQAAATCRGSVRYVPKIGSREPRVEPRVWNFTLRKVGAEWKIESARTF